MLRITAAASAAAASRALRRSCRRHFVSDTIGLKAEPISAYGAPGLPIFFVDDAARPVSPWHDLPLRQGWGRDGRGAAAGASIAAAPESAVFNFVCEVPRGSRAEYRVATDAPHNPIAFAHSADGRPRLHALEPLANHGVLPQTFEDTAVADPLTGKLGDGGPLDVCEISSLGKPTTGAIYQVRILGALAVLTAEGRTDWKVLALRTDDPLAQTLHDITSAPASVRRQADDIRSWFRLHEVPGGGRERALALGGEWQGRAVALAVVEASHARWLALTKRARRAAAAAATKITYGEAAALKRLESAPWVGPADASGSGAPRHYNLVEASLASVRLGHTLARDTSSHAASSSAGGSDAAVA